MCGRYSFTDTQAVYKRFDIVDELRPIYNVAPSMTMPVVVRHSPNSIKHARWGFLPTWAAGKPGARELINGGFCITPQKGAVGFLGRWNGQTLGGFLDAPR